MKYYRVYLKSGSGGHYGYIVIKEDDLWRYEDDEYYSCDNETPIEPTLQEILRIIEDQLESGNYHNECGIVGDLAELITKETSETITYIIFKAILENNIFMR